MKKLDLLGKTFGHWLVLKQCESKRKTGKIIWFCKCLICGTIGAVSSTNLTNSISTKCKYCGPKFSTKSSTHNHTVGKRASAEYTAWRAIKQRCLSVNSPNYKDYGGRGIAIHKNWVNDFSQFLKDVGPKPSPKFHLNRIDNNGNYEPGNCNWVSAKENQRNKRSNITLTHEGQTKTVVEWADITGLTPATIRTRISAGWSADSILTTPRRKQTSKITQRQSIFSTE